MQISLQVAEFFWQKIQTFLDIFFFVERYPGFGVHYNIDLLPPLLSNLKYFIGILPRSTTLQPDTFCRILTIPSMGKYQKGKKKTCRHLCLFECYNFYLIVGSEQKKWLHLQVQSLKNTVLSFCIFALYLFLLSISIMVGA